MEVDKEKLKKLAEIAYDAGRLAGLKRFDKTLNESFYQSEFTEVSVIRGMLDHVIKHYQKEASIND